MGTKGTQKNLRLRQRQKGDHVVRPRLQQNRKGKQRHKQRKAARQRMSPSRRRKRKRNRKGMKLQSQVTTPPLRFPRMMRKSLYQRMMEQRKPVPRMMTVLRTRTKRNKRF